MIIVSTAFIGSCLITLGILHLLPGAQDVSVQWINHLRFGSPGILGYVALDFWLVLGLAGVRFQYRGGPGTRGARAADKLADNRETKTP